MCNLKENEINKISEEVTNGRIKKLTDEDILNAKQSYECELIILNYMKRRIKDTKMLEEILVEINFIFTYIKTYDESKDDINEYDNFNFQEKLEVEIKNRKEIKILNSRFEKFMFNKLLLLSSVLKDEKINLNKQQIEYLNKILMDLVFNINFY